MIYTTRKGKHYSSYWFRPFFKNFIKRTVRFNITARYNIDLADQGDINKLIGFSEGSNVHYNSARFGWNYDEEIDKINLFAYTYVKGERQFKFLRTVEIDKPYSLAIYIFDYGDDIFSSYTFSIDGVGWLIDRGFIKSNNNLKFILPPYFGGNQPSPHDITIELF